MIERDAKVPDHFLVLDRKETFGDYARTYGASLAQHYENRGVIVVPYVPIDFDRELFQSLTFPPEWKKIGSANGIEESLYMRDGETLTDRVDHPFRSLGMGPEWASYLQSQVASFDWQLRRGLSVLFPAYRTLQDANITWRLTETIEEGMHLDAFGAGAPLRASDKLAHRLKIFVNIDGAPRRWRTSLDLPGVLEACRDRLPPALPDDLNVVNDVIDKEGVLKTLPYHKLEYPPMAAVICNGEAVAHEVVYGLRTIGAEFMCHYRDMLDPAKHTHHALRGWLEGAGYRIAPDPAAVAAEYAQRKGSYALIQEARAKQAR
jgi:hypothetical protein